MMYGFRFIASVALFSLITTAAVAGPKDGFGFNGGLASYDIDNSVDSSGISIGVDYQFAVNEQFSISPFLMSSGESTSISGVSVGHGIFGVQFRYWSNDVFFGGHFGNYSEVRTNGWFTLSGSGGGSGLVAGWENPETGFYMMGQLDSAIIDYGFAEIDISGFRFSVGKRWK